MRARQRRGEIMCALHVLSKCAIHSSDREPVCSRVATCVHWRHLTLRKWCSRHVGTVHGCVLHSRIYGVT